MNAPPRKRLTGSYYGTRNADFFPQLFIQRAIAGRSFSDITSGTGQFPYRLAVEHRKPVILFERCPYVGFLLRAVFERTINGSWAARKGVLPEGRRAGYLSSRSDLLGRIFSEHMAERIDFLAHYALEHRDEALSHAVGHALNSILTFRSLNWCVSTAKKIPSVDVPIEFVEKKILAVLEDLVQYSAAIPHEVAEQCVVRVGDSVKLVPKAGELFKDCVVYADPAWPWAGKANTGAANDNPYRFAYEEMSSILVQDQLTLDTIWSRRDEERIKSETLGWVEGAFRNGARQFISCTQDTNFPHPDVVRQWFIDAGYKVPHTMLLHDYSASANREYINYWFFITP